MTDTINQTVSVTRDDNGDYRIFDSDTGETVLYKFQRTISHDMQTAYLAKRLKEMAGDGAR